MIAVMALLPCGQGGQGLFEDLKKSSKSTRPLSGFARNATIFRTEGNGFLCRQPISCILEQRDCAFDPSFTSSREQSMARLRACRSTRCCEEPVSGVQGCQLLQKTQCTTFWNCYLCHSIVSEEVILSKYCTARHSLAGDGGAGDQPSTGKPSKKGQSLLFTPSLDRFRGQWGLFTEFDSIKSDQRQLSQLGGDGDAGRADCRCHSLVHSVWWYVGYSLRSFTSGRVQQMFIRT